MKATGNSDAALLLAKINFHMKNTSLKKDGMLCIARKRDQLSSWFNFSSKKVDRLLKLLEERNLIKKRVGMYYGEKRLFISSKSIEAPVNEKLLHSLIEQTGSVQAAIVYAKIAFAQNNSQIELNAKKCVAFTRDQIAYWIGVSTRTVDKILAGLCEKGLISKQYSHYKGKSRLHLHVTSPSLKVVIHNKEKNFNVKSQICTAEKGISIKETLYKNKEDNIIKDKPKRNVKGLFKKKNEIGFVSDKVESELTGAQVSYVKGAIDRTVERFRLNISNPKEFFEQVLFSIRSEYQHNGVVGFRHRLNRCMKILAAGNWLTPKGFETKTLAGKAYRSERNKFAIAHEKSKQSEINSPVIMHKLLTNESSKKQLKSKALSVIHKINALKLLAKKKPGDAAVVSLVEEHAKDLHDLVNHGLDSSWVIEELSKDELQDSN